MQQCSVMLTSHARQRLAQRNLSVEDIELVCHVGTREHRAGLVCYFMGRRQLQKLGNLPIYERLSDVAVLCCPHCNCVITAYHNSHALRDMRRKSKRNWLDKACRFCGE